MRAQRIAALAAGAALALACGDDAATDAATPTVPPPANDARPIATSDAGEDAGEDAGLTPPFDDEPDTACVDVGGSASVVYPAAATPPAFDTLGTVGDRWFASTRDEMGFVLFDADGANATSPPVTVDVHSRATSDGAVLHVLGRGQSGLTYARFDDQGQPLGDFVHVAGSLSATRHAIGAGPSGAMLLWSTPTDLRGVGVDLQGSVPSPEPFALEPTSAAKGSFVAAAASAGDRFAIAWSVVDGASPWRTELALATASALTAPPTRIYASAVPHTLAGAVTLGTNIGVVVNVPEPPALLFVVVDGAGHVVRARRLAGASSAFGVTARGDELAVVALRSDQRIELRSFSADGTPLGPWRCLDGPTKPQVDPSAAIGAHADGYAVLYRTPDGGQSLLHVDRLGAGRADAGAPDAGPDADTGDAGPDADTGDAGPDAQ